MICEILSVGTELLLGDIVDTNAAYLSRSLREMGLFVYHRQTVGDHKERIREAFQTALSRSDLVLVTGGLGPTYDDLSREVAAEVFEAPLIFHEETANEIRAFFQRRGVEMSENNLRQAMVPEGAKVLSNAWGTAPGLWLEKNGKSMILLPGVPNEMKNLFLHRVRPHLSRRCEKRFANLILHFYGISESLLDEKLSDLMRKSQNPTVAPYAGKGEVEVHVTAFSETEEEAAFLCRKAGEEVLSRVGKFCYGEGDTSLERELVVRLRKAGVPLAVAERGTAGLLAYRIASVPGAEEALSFAFSSSGDKMPENALSASCVFATEEERTLSMARAARRLGACPLGIALNGDQKKEKNVRIALSSPDKEFSETYVPGRRDEDPEEVWFRAASRAIFLALRHFCPPEEKN